MKPEVGGIILNYKPVPIYFFSTDIGTGGTFVSEFRTDFELLSVLQNRYFLSTSFSCIQYFQEYLVTQQIQMQKEWPFRSFSY